MNNLNKKDTAIVITAVLYILIGMCIPGLNWEQQAMLDTSFIPATILIMYKLFAK